jgi:predicted Zn-dependent protease
MERGDLLDSMGCVREAVDACREAVRRLQENHASDQSLARAVDRLARALARDGQAQEAAAASARARHLLSPTGARITR